MTGEFGYIIGTLLALCSLLIVYAIVCKVVNLVNALSRMVELTNNYVNSLSDLIIITDELTHNPECKTEFNKELR